MKDLKLIEGDIPTGFKKGSESFLFNTPEYRNLQDKDKWISFHLVDEGKANVPASIHFHILGQEAMSPAAAPFGSIEFAASLPTENLFDFFGQVETALYELGVRRITVKNPPAVYQPLQSPIAEALFINSGYSVQNAEINMSIGVTEKNFENQVDEWEQRKLKQSRKAGLEFREIPNASLETIYHFIDDCRKERGQSLSMTFEALEKTVKILTGQFLIFGVFLDQELVAASVCIRVSKNILYNFYSAHPRKMDAMSPIVALTEGLYNWCWKNKIPVLDLGTSALSNLPNFNLLEFKKRLGGVPGTRYTYVKLLP